MVWMNMRGLKNFLIAFSEDLPKGSTIVPTNEFVGLASKYNFSSSTLAKEMDIDLRMTIPKQEDGSFFKSDVCCNVRGKKRRLDHLTWEEKLQRKKLKNRVAAQTSRDRKKAKLDELEEMVRVLSQRNNVLTQEWWDTTIDVVPDTSTRSNHIAENYDPLPPFEELFGDLQEDDYIERLEELAESLLREVTTEVETNTNRSDEQVSVEGNTVKKSDNSERMVGEASKNVETDAIDGRSLNGNNSWHSNCIDVALIVPDNSRTPIDIENDIKVKKEPDINDIETIYGTYDETTHSITIIYPSQGDNLGIQECVEEISSSDNAYHVDDVTSMTMHHSCSNQYSPAYSCTDTSDSHFSDGGYESHSSPSPDIPKNNKNDKRNNNHSNICLTDTWHESFTELFPMLV
ncbi:hypothetical protein M0802_002925 [Mischocyttarus mexicanus]|nr:hypothetical protein M0802_002925 [Mischocyttarus mexicanus]